MVLALLIVMWVAVLTPALLKGRMARRGGGDSVRSFRQQINVIGRTAPATIPAAHRRVPRQAEVSGMGVVTPIRPLREGVPYAGEPGLVGAGQLDSGRGPVGGRGPVVGRGPVGGRAVGSVVRSRQLQRRRQVLVTLLVAVVLTFLVGLVPSLRMVWGATGLCTALLLGYVFLLVRMKSLAAEREMKLAFLPRQVEPSLMLRRSAN